MKKQPIILSFIILGFAIFGFSSLVITMARASSMFASVGVFALCVFAFFVITGIAWSTGFNRGRENVIGYDDSVKIIEGVLRVNAEYTRDMYRDTLLNPSLRSEEHLEAYVCEKRDEFTKNVKKMLQEVIDENNK